ncbi:hypothetical protein OC845_006127, partial [Tilletia horrida]
MNNERGIAGNHQYQYPPAAAAAASSSASSSSASNQQQQQQQSRPPTTSSAAAFDFDFGHFLVNQQQPQSALSAPHELYSNPGSAPPQQHQLYQQIQLPGLSPALQEQQQQSGSSTIITPGGSKVVIPPFPLGSSFNLANFDFNSLSQVELDALTNAADSYDPALVQNTSGTGSSSNPGQAQPPLPVVTSPTITISSPQESAYSTTSESTRASKRRRSILEMPLVDAPPTAQHQLQHVTRASQPLAQPPQRPFPKPRQPPTPSTGTDSPFPSSTAHRSRANTTPTNSTSSNSHSSSSTGASSSNISVTKTTMTTTTATTTMRESSDSQTSLSSLSSSRSSGRNVQHTKQRGGPNATRAGGGRTGKDSARRSATTSSNNSRSAAGQASTPAAPGSASSSATTSSSLGHRLKMMRMSNGPASSHSTGTSQLPPTAHSSAIFQTSTSGSAPVPPQPHTLPFGQQVPLNFANNPAFMRMVMAAAVAHGASPSQSHPHGRDQRQSFHSGGGHGMGIAPLDGGLADILVPPGWIYVGLLDGSMTVPAELIQNLQIPYDPIALASSRPHSYEVLGDASAAMTSPGAVSLSRQGSSHRPGGTPPLQSPPQAVSGGKLNGTHSGANNNSRSLLGSPQRTNPTTIRQQAASPIALFAHAAASASNSRGGSSNPPPPPPSGGPSAVDLVPQPSSLAAAAAAAASKERAAAEAREHGAAAARLPSGAVGPRSHSFSSVSASPAGSPSLRQEGTGAGPLTGGSDSCSDSSDSKMSVKIEQEADDVESTIEDRRIGTAAEGKEVAHVERHERGGDEGSEGRGRSRSLSQRHHVPMDDREASGGSGAAPADAHAGDEDRLFRWDGRQQVSGATSAGAPEASPTRTMDTIMDEGSSTITPGGAPTSSTLGATFSAGEGSNAFFPSTAAEQPSDVSQDDGNQVGAGRAGPNAGERMLSGTAEDEADVPAQGEMLGGGPVDEEAEQLEAALDGSMARFYPLTKKEMELLMYWLRFGIVPKHSRTDLDLLCVVADRYGIRELIEAVRDAKDTRYMSIQERAEFDGKAVGEMQRHLGSLVLWPDPRRKGEGDGTVAATIAGPSYQAVCAVLDDELWDLPSSSRKLVPVDFRFPLSMARQGAISPFGSDQVRELQGQPGWDSLATSSSGRQTLWNTYRDDPDRQVWHRIFFDAVAKRLWNDGFVIEREM